MGLLTLGIQNKGGRMYGPWARQNWASTIKEVEERRAHEPIGSGCPG